MFVDVMTPCVSVCRRDDVTCFLFMFVNVMTSHVIVYVCRRDDVTCFLFMFVDVMTSHVFVHVCRRDDAGVQGGVAHVVRVHHAAAAGGV